MNKLLSYAGAGILLGMSILALPAHAELGTSEDGLWQYFDYDDDKGTVSVTLLDKTVTKAEIPAVIDGKTITMIEVDCFNGCENLTSVTIPETITVIDDYAFYQCAALERVTIPESVTKIGFQTFYGCSSLTEIRIPAAVEEIEEFAFEGCNALDAVDVADGNRNYKDVEGVLFDYEGTTLMLYPSAKTDTEYSIPEGCTVIEDFAFIGNTYLRSVNIDHITELGEDAFYYCTALESIAIPDAITELKGAVFGNCMALQSVKLPAELVRIGDSCFYNCHDLTEIDIPETVTEIGNYAFFNCPLLKEIRLTKTTGVIGNYALGFYYNGGEEPSRVPGFQVDADDDTAAFTYCVNNSIKCTGGITQGTVFIYIILGVVLLVIAATVAIVIVQKRIQKRYEIR